MYDVKNEILFLQIPKNGSQTLKRVIRNNIEKTIDYGHITYQSFERHVKQTFAIARNPLQRLQSSINYICDTEEHVDQVFSIIYTNKFNSCYVNNCLPTNIILRPQCYFIKGAKKLTSYKLENINIFFNDMKWDENNIKLNTSTNKFSLDYIKSHSLFDKAITIYDEDFIFYEKSI